MMGHSDLNGRVCKALSVALSPLRYDQEGT